MLPLRIILNRIYVHLVTGMDSEQREKFDGELYAPPEGWDAVEAQLFAAMARAAGEAVNSGTDS